MKNLVIVIAMLVALSATAQTTLQTQQGQVFHQANGGTSTWYPPSGSVGVKTPCYGTAPVANGPAPSSYASASASGPVSAPAGVSAADPTGAGSLRSGIVAARPVSSGNPDVDREQGQQDLQWGQLAVERERSNQEANLRKMQIQAQVAQDVMQYDIQRRYVANDAVRTWSSAIQEYQDGKAQREDLKAQRRLQAQQQSQWAAQQAADRAQQALQNLAWAQQNNGGGHHGHR